MRLSDVEPLDERPFPERFKLTTYLREHIVVRYAFAIVGGTLLLLSLTTCPATRNHDDMREMLDAAPLDDEPLDDEERAGLAESWRDEGDPMKSFASSRVA